MFKSKTINKFLQKRGYSLTDAKTFIDKFGEWFNINAESNNFTGWVGDCAEVMATYYTEYHPVLKDWDKEGEPVLDHPLLDLFDKPNNFQTWWEIKYRIALHEIFYGSSPLYKVRDVAGVPRQLLQLHPPNLEIKSSDTEYIDHYEYQLGTEIRVIPRDDIILFKNPALDNLIEGEPLVKKILNQVEVDKLQTEYQKQFYKKGGFAGLVFASDTYLGQEQFTKTQEQLIQQYQGLNKSYGVKLVNAVKPINAGYSIKEMEITPQRKLTMDEITSAFKIPKILLGQGEAVNRATAETAKYQYADGVIEPRFNYFDNILTQDLCVKDFGYISINQEGQLQDSPYYIEHISIVPEDKESNLKEDVAGANEWLSINEIRQKRGLESWEPEYDRPVKSLKEFKPIDNGSEQST